MASLSFNWENLWAIYDNLLPEAKRQATDCLEAMLKTSSPSSQAKALEAAPQSIIKAHAHLLHPIAKKKLGLEEQRKEKFTKSWSSILS